MKRIATSAEALARELDTLAQRLPARVINRLRHHRNRVVCQPGAVRRHHSLLSLSSPWLHQHRIMVGSLLLAFLLGGLGTYQRNASRVHSAGDVDACLLGSDLPPAAFANPQFAQWLQEHAQQ